LAKNITVSVTQVKESDHLGALIQIWWWPEWVGESTMLGHGLLPHYP